MSKPCNSLVGRVPLFGRGLLLAAAVLPCAQAQELGFSKDLKVRLGYGLQAKDELRQTSLGFGLNLGYGTSIGRFSAELGYYYKTGDSFFPATGGAVPAPLSPVDPVNSGDSRRNQLDGFSVRFSYERRLNPEWAWQAGLMVGGTRFKHDYFGDVRSTDWNATNPESWRDTYSGTPVESGLKVSPFVGVSYALTPHSSLEFNLLVLNYTALDYVHHPGSGAYAFSTDPASDPSAGQIADHNAFPADGVTKSNRLVPHFEFGYVIHF